ncbi:MAG: MFS transporter [Chromatiales bacterium]|jgi:predicted MFS family arabinose efflux permease
MQTGFSGRMTGAELRSSVTLSSVYAVRMLGLFMVLPVFALYAEELEHVTPFLVGLAIGAYGLTQAAMQIPLGALSDRIGRKPVIIGGLLVFALGSALAAVSDSIYGVILGRALQGAGAIASALMALASDLTREEHRTKVMAIIGLSIGASFSLAMAIGPILDRWIGVAGIFWLTAALAGVAVLIVLGLVPQPLRGRFHRDVEAVPSEMPIVFRDPQLLRLDLGIFVLHLVLTANFVVIPVLLRDHIGLDAGRHWLVYLPIVVASFLAMVPVIVVAEKQRRMKPVFVTAVGLLALAEFSLVFDRHSLAGLVISLFVFFWAFNLLEAVLPSLVVKFAPPDRKGTAMGAYSSSQFLGIFVGGALGGALHGAFGPEAVFVGGAIAALGWLFAALTMRRPRYLSSYLLNVGRMDADRARDMVVELTRVRGVAEAVVIAEEGVAYLKVEPKALDQERLQRFSVSPA